MSQSSRPTFAPRCRSPQARLTDTVDLPTPPLPLATATMRLMPGTRFWFDHGPGPPAPDGPPGAAAGCLTSTCTIFTPGKLLSTRSLSSLICRAASALAEVNCIETLTAPD